MANRDLGVLDPTTAQAIIHGCDRLIAGRCARQFVTDIIQGGAGTSTNMNANEVIANLALEYLGPNKGDYEHVNPNDHVNFGQSTNDVYPTALRLCADHADCQLLGRLAPSPGGVRAQGAKNSRGPEDGPHALAGRGAQCRSGDEVHGWGTTIGEEVQRIARSRLLLRRNQPRCDGDRHVGDGARRDIPSLRRASFRPHRHCSSCLAHDLVEATSDTGVFVQLSGVLKRTAVKLTKICNDIRLLRFGPRCGLNEIDLPQLQPGSSIMPGKVNPVIPEVVNQTSFLVIGLDVTVTLAASAGQLQLNVMEPVIAYSLFTSIAAMENAVD